MSVRPILVVIGAVSLLAAAIAVPIGVSRLTDLRQVEATACNRTAPLIPRALAGPPWQRHRHWLEPGESGVPPGRSYLVWNQRTGERFRWDHTEGRSGEPRFMVPTRYAAVANRGWRDDAWAYCLVLAPEPPFRLRQRGFETSSRVEDAVLEAGATAAIATSVIAEHDTTVLIDIELHNERGVKVAQWVFAEESLRAGRPATYAVEWRSPIDAEAGIYLITVGIFAPGWGRLRHWNDGTAVLLVGTSRPSSPGDGQVGAAR
jgi:hypothetical protein